MPVVPFRKKAGQAFVALSNLDSFLGAARAFGVSDVALFQPSDLYEGRKGQLLHTLNCLDALGRLVSAKLKQAREMYVLKIQGVIALKFSSSF